ncbi:MAG: NACHT domain-containing protein [Chloroflexales bacterium]|nr:NACHT domain-containing protein [Chloroflexales bacterium]
MTVGKVRNFELESLLRVLVHTVAAASRKTIAGVEVDLAEAIGTTPKGFQNFYVSRAKYDFRAIQVLLTCAAGCPYMTRVWGERLLRLSGFDRDDHCLALLDTLWPPDPSRSLSLPGRRTNLPPPMYASFVMRPTAFQLVKEALAARSPMVVLEGMGGIGKTSLAREIAGSCLAATAAEREAGLPGFEVVIWVSDKDHPGKTRLSGVLDLIVDLLGAPELTRLAPEKKQSAAEQLLRAQRVLLVLDNLDTVSDPALLAWLPTIPEPSKALVTSRESRPELYARGAWRVELKQMTEVEGSAFIGQYSRQIGLIPAPDEAARQVLIVGLGGNPKAIAILLGMAKRCGQPPTHLLGERQSDLGELVASSWAALSPTEQQIGLALSLFPASVADSVLAQVAGIDSTAYYASIEKLSDLSLIETEHLLGTATAGEVRRSLHPVTRQYIEAQLREEGLFAAAARARRAAWAVEFASVHGGFRPNEPQALAHIATEEANLWAVFQWASDHGPDRDALILAQQLEFFYYTRALWGRNHDLYQRAIRAARRLDDMAALSDALALFVVMVSRQGQPEQAQDELAELVALSRSEALQGAQFFRAEHARALAHLARDQYEAAAAAWQRILDKGSERGVSAQLIGGTLHWLGLCRQRQGEVRTARVLLEQSLALALEQGNQRRAARNQIALASLALDRSDADEAARRLGDAAQLDPAPDLEQRAHYLHALGRLQALQGAGPVARQTLTEAAELFTRMGLSREAQEARVSLGSKAS